MAPLLIIAPAKKVLTWLVAFVDIGNDCFEVQVARHLLVDKIEQGPAQPMPARLPMDINCNFGGVNIGVVRIKWLKSTPATNFASDGDDPQGVTVIKLVEPILPVRNRYGLALVSGNPRLDSLIKNSNDCFLIGSLSSSNHNILFCFQVNSPTC